MIPLIQKYVFTGDADGARKIIEGAGYYDEGGKLDVADVANQLRWFVAQGLVKTAGRPGRGDRHPLHRRPAGAMTGSGPSHPGRAASATATTR